MATPRWVLTIILVLTGDVSDLSISMQDTFKAELAALVGVQAADISLDVSAASINVVVTVIMTSETTAYAAQQLLNAMGIQALGTALGVTILQPILVDTQEVCD